MRIALTLLLTLAPQLAAAGEITRIWLGETLRERFPLVGRFLNAQGEPVISRLLPEQMAKTLAGVFG